MSCPFSANVALTGSLTLLFPPKRFRRCRHPPDFGKSAPADVGSDFSATRSDILGLFICKDILPNFLAGEGVSDAGLSKLPGVVSFWRKRSNDGLRPWNELRPDFLLVGDVVSAAGSVPAVSGRGASIDGRPEKGLFSVIDRR